jgi:hypothetical protein
VALLDKLAEKGVGSAKILLDGKWFDQLTSRADKIVGEISDPTIRVRAAEGLDVLRPLKGDLAHVGEEGLVAFVGYLGLGQKEKARLLYLAQSASLDELFATSNNSTNEIVKAKAEAERRKEAFLNVAQKLGEVALRLLPILLAAI